MCYGEIQNIKYKMHTDPIATFLNIVRRNNTPVRVTPNGLLYAADLVMAISSKHRRHANEVLRELDDEYFSKSNYSHFKRQKVLTLSNAIQLVMVLPLKAAAPARSKFIDILLATGAVSFDF